MSDRRYYSDTEHVAESLEKIQHISFYSDEPGYVHVYETDVIMDGLTWDEMEARNVASRRGDEICTFKYDGVRLELTFHQSMVDGEFSLTATRNRTNTPSLSNMAPKVGQVLESIRENHRVISYDFMEVSSASIASGGHFTDFEFKYAVTTPEF